MWSGGDRIAFSFERSGTSLMVDGRGFVPWPSVATLKRWGELVSSSGAGADRNELNHATLDMFETFFAGPFDGFSALPRMVVAITGDPEVDQLPLEASGVPAVDGVMTAEAPLRPLVDEVHLFRAFHPPSDEPVLPPGEPLTLRLIEPGTRDGAISRAVSNQHREIERVASALGGVVIDHAGATITHVICHGRAASDGWPGGCFEFGRLISADEMADIIAPDSSAAPRIAVLMVCDGAAPDITGSLASRLLERGVRMVIASRAPLSGDDASRFCRGLYRSFAAGNDLQACVRSGRLAIRESMAPLHHAVLGCYLGAADLSNPYRFVPAGTSDSDRRHKFFNDRVVIPFEPVPPSEPVERERHIDSIRSRPDRLLAPELRLISLVGRDREINQLRGWANSDLAFSVALVSGATGVGKSRLLAELVYEQREAGWLAGTLQNTAVRMNAAAIVNELASTASIRSNTLIVIDRAESRVDLVELLVGRAWTSSPKLRVVLAVSGDAHDLVAPAEWFPSLATTPGIMHVELSPTLETEFVEALHSAVVDVFSERLGPAASRPTPAGSTALQAVVAASAPWLDSTSGRGFAVRAIDWWIDRLDLPTSERRTLASLLAAAVALRPSDRARLREVTGPLATFDPAVWTDQRIDALVEAGRHPIAAVGAPVVVRGIASLGLQVQDTLERWIGSARGPELNALLVILIDLIGATDPFLARNQKLLDESVARWAITARERNDMVIPLAGLVASNDEWSTEALIAVFDSIPVPFQPSDHALVLAASRRVAKRFANLSAESRAERIGADVDSATDLIGSLTAYADYCLQLERPTEAVEAIDLAIQLGEPLLGVSSEELGDAFAELALRSTSVGRYRAALAPAQAALQIRRRLRGERHPDTLTSLGNLAALYQMLGELERARPLNEEAYRLRCEVLGERHPDTLSSLNNLGSLYKSLGELERARPLNEEAYRLSCEVLGERHPDTLMVLSNLAGLYRAVGELERARPLMEEAYRLSCEVLGERHPDTLMVLHNLAGLYYVVGELERARPLMEEGYRLRCEVLGERHSDTLSSLHNLASLYRAVGELERARPLIEEGYRLRCEVLGERHPDTLRSLNSLDALAREQSR